MTKNRKQVADEVNENRKALFDEATMKRRRGKSSGSSNTAVEAASIQNSLSRTQHLLKNELNRVNQLGTAIEDDGLVLKNTLITHETLNVSKAKHALTKLQSAQRREQRVLLASIIFFCSVVIYILFVRIIMHIPFVDRMIASLRLW